MKILVRLTKFNTFLISHRYNEASQFWTLTIGWLVLNDRLDQIIEVNNFSFHYFLHVARVPLLNYFGIDQPLWTLLYFIRQTFFPQTLNHKDIE